PPVDFALYGLDRASTSAGWLDYVDGSFGDPAAIVWLAHGDRRRPVRGHPWILVATARLSDRRWCPPGVAPERELAWGALYRLMNITVPAMRTPRDRRRLGRNFVPYLER